MQSLFTDIRTKYNTLSPTQKQVADFILNNSEQVILLAITDLAEKCNTSETTVVRFLHKLGFKSYQVFRVRMAQEITEQSVQGVYEEITKADSAEQIREKVILSTVNSLQDLNKMIDGEVLERVVDLIITSDKIIICGLGASGAVAMDAFHKLLRLGLNVVAFTDNHLMSIGCAQATQKTTVLAISHSGESRDILEAVGLAQEAHANIVAFTSYQHSSVTKLADYVLLSSSNETKFRSDAMTSRILQFVTIDMLYVSIVLKLGRSAVRSVNKSRLAVAAKKV
ncbi:MAG: MurR/RpiR family transcriptional regulator [Firmicutes bacterium]|nr:MurR/RpiR family transcriptional regulator [Bacillota bacterium]